MNTGYAELLLNCEAFGEANFQCTIFNGLTEKLHAIFFSISIVLLFFWQLFAGFIFCILNSEFHSISAR